MNLPIPLSVSIGLIIMAAIVYAAYEMIKGRDS